MKFRNTIILLVVFGALLAYFLLLEKDRSPSGSTGTPTPTPTNVFTFESSDVVELNLTDGAKTTVLKRDNDVAPWKIVTPITENGDSVTINGVVQPMSSLSASRVFTDSESTGDPAAFGLVKPKLIVTAKLKDGKEYSLRIGDKTPDSVNAYVQKPDDKTIYLVNATLADGASGMLDKPPVAPPTPTPTATATLTTTVGMTATVGVTTTEPVSSSAPVTGATTIVTGSTTIIVASPTLVGTPAVLASPTPTVTATAPVTLAATIESTATAALTPTATALAPAITATVAITP